MNESPQHLTTLKREALLWQLMEERDPPLSFEEEDLAMYDTLWEQRQRTFNQQRGKR